MPHTLIYSCNVLLPFDKPENSTKMTLCAFDSHPSRCVCDSQLVRRAPPHPLTHRTRDTGRIQCETALHTTVGHFPPFWSRTT